MFNCHKDVLAYHDDEVTLPMSERSTMRDRRDANRRRLREGLDRIKKPMPLESISQGSYQMLTMVQAPDSDYDIDDGQYFAKETLVGPRGAAFTALQAREMVRDALDDGSFKTKPEVRENCVRVYYEAGYHADLPVYRRFTTKDWFGAETTINELAGADWKRSDARSVTDWFTEVNDRKSPDTGNGRQLRRTVRLIKKFARSRAGWKGQILSGFGISILVAECYSADVAREDESLHNTMRAMRDRLKWDLVVNHPIANNNPITKGSSDARARFLRERLSDAIRWLEPTHEHGCPRTTALKCWDKVYDTDFFIKRDDDDKGDGGSASRDPGPGVLSAGLFRPDAGTPPPVRKDGGGRYA